MQNITRDEAIALENKMLKAYFIIRYIGLGLWVLGMTLTTIAIFLDGDIKAVFSLLGALGFGFGIVGLMISADIEILRCKHISERTDKELKEKWAELEAEAKK